jgi:hypothetical protein
LADPTPEKVQLRAAERRVIVEVLPSVLKLHMKRFFWHGTRREKLKGKVLLPLELEANTLFPVEVGPNAPKRWYDLTAVIVHEGRSIHSGHYKAYVRHSHTCEWLLANDARVTFVSQDEVLQAQAYLLFYAERSETQRAKAMLQTVPSTPAPFGLHAMAAMPHGRRPVSPVFATAEAPYLPGRRANGGAGGTGADHPLESVVEDDFLLGDDAETEVGWSRERIEGDIDVTPVPRRKRLGRPPGRGKKSAVSATRTDDNVSEGTHSTPENDADADCVAARSASSTVQKRQSSRQQNGTKSSTAANRLPTRSQQRRSADASAVASTPLPTAAPATAVASSNSRKKQRKCAALDAELELANRPLTRTQARR